MQILMNHVGFEPKTKKTVILQTKDQSCISGPIDVSVVDSREKKKACSAQFCSSGCVDGWKGRFFHEFDFSELRKPGVYVVIVKSGELTIESQAFEVRDGLYANTCISDILFYLKAQRSSGKWDQADRQAPFWGGRKDRVDVHGGWYDAAGDYGKYLSHLSYAEYFNPQQIPLVVWALTELCETLLSRKVYKNVLLPERALEEAYWGADFLVRMQDREGYFYSTVFDRWSKKTDERMICSFRTKKGDRFPFYQAGFRQGGGMAIAALARVSTIKALPETRGEYTSADYLRAAETGYNHLRLHNREYLNNRKENIIDYYCGLLAAVELYNATGKDTYLEDCRQWSSLLVSLFSPDIGWFFTEKGSRRPFCHASDEGLPIAALVKYCKAEPLEEKREQISQVIGEICAAKIELSASVYNPFSLPRKWVQPVGGSSRQSFFIPHKNETGYWWQGENAGLASLSSAFKMAADVIHDNEDKTSAAGLIEKVRKFSDSQINWILGMNPFDICMLQGRGRNNPEYEEFYPNAPGGICNGITAGFIDENDIDFLPASVRGMGDHRWRWSEQWLPHAAWFLMAIIADQKDREYT